MLDRLRADTRLDATSPAVLRDAADRLTILTADESIPLVHRAETWHNLGTVQDRLGQRDAAIASFKRAAELNPSLDAAREELERLQAPPPAPS
jgi:tetratricopeptide (TPR) repeat protein